MRFGSIVTVAVALACLAPGATVRADDERLDPNGYDPTEIGGPTPIVDVPRLDVLPGIEDFLPTMGPSPAFDGRMARIAGGFVQRDPEDGRPASQHTDVYLAYDDEHLVVVFVAFDDEPDRVRAHMAARENVFRDEIVEIQLDTFLDRRRAYTFVSNPLGVQWDAIWTEGSGFDDSYDTVWDSDGRLTDRGYVVWMRIPFKSLRFPRTDAQTWGFLLVRDIPRNNESSFFPRMSNRIRSRMGQGGTLVGLDGISPGRNLQVIPYATATSFEELDRDAAAFVEDDADLDGGVDAKAVIRDGLVLDATFNPDFSQVESDEPQVTVNQRFEVFFPEKRPFFLENAGFFETPVNLLFTRRIADPRQGVRMTGKVGGNNVGVLWIDDEAPGRRLPATDPDAGEDAEFRVVRWSHDVGAQSEAGALYTERRFAGGTNRVQGVDARIALGEHWIGRAQWVESRTTRPGEADRDGRGRWLQLDRSGRHLGVHLHALAFTRDFRTEAGFVPRVDQKDVHGQLGWTFWPEGRRLISWKPTLYRQRIVDEDGLRLESRTTAGLELSFRRQTTLSVQHGEADERLRPVDFAALVAPADYDTRTTSVRLRSEPTRSFGATVELERGRTIHFAPPAGLPPGSADLDRASVEVRLRPLERFRVELEGIFTRLDDAADGGRIFDDAIARGRLDWQFDRRSSVRFIARYDSLSTDPARTVRETEKRWDLDLLYRYLIDPWTALYVGASEGRVNLDRIDVAGTPTLVRTDDADLRDSRQVFVKLSWLFRL